MGAELSWRLPPYALLVPIMPAAWLYGGNAGRLTIWHGVLTACILACSYVATRAVLRLAFRRHPAVDPALATGFILTTCPLFLPGVEALVGLLFALWIVTLIFILRWEPVRQAVNTFLTAFPLAVIGMSALAVLQSPVWAKRDAIEQLTAVAFRSDSQLIATRTESRDIYYLVFDRYARADQLRRVYDFDNQEFLDSLRKRGFTVLDEAFANYQRTTHSLVSALNFEYLDALDTQATRGSTDWLPLYRMLGDTRIARFLKGQGYTFHFFGTWWEPTRTNAQADFVHNWFSMPEALRTVYENSLLVWLARSSGIRQLDPLWMQCERTRRMFAKLPALDEPGSKFVFAHFLVPHPPFVFDEAGRCMQVDEARSRSRTTNYVGQVKYANERILGLLDDLLARPGLKPIVILQADEGPWPKKYAGEEVTRLGRDVSSVDWRRATSDELQEKMAIFSAQYLPGESTTRAVPLNDGPANTFRRILRAYFGVEIEALPNRHFIYESDADLYRFREITEQLRSRGSVSETSKD